MADILLYWVTIGVWYILLVPITYGLFKAIASNKNSSLLLEILAVVWPVSLAVLAIWIPMKYMTEHVSEISESVFRKLFRKPHPIKASASELPKAKVYYRSDNDV